MTVNTTAGAPHLGTNRETSPSTRGATRPLDRGGGLPKVAGAPLFGALPELLRDHFAALRRWQRAHGGLFEVDVGAASFVVAGDTNAAAEMLLERHRAFLRGSPSTIPWSAPSATAS